MSEPVPEVTPQPRVMPEGRRFVAGQSGNPKGRPKGLARKVREIVGDNDGETIARFWAAGMSGRLPNPEWDEKNPTKAPQYVTLDPKDRVLCSRLLAERGWGKPPMFAPIEDDDPLDFAEREADEVAAEFDARMDELAERRRAREQQQASG
jgi:Family of unknown function (DUF5681)